MTRTGALPPEPPLHEIDDILARCLAEDLGPSGDITSTAIFTASHESNATIVARAAGVVAGLGISLRTFSHLAGEVRTEIHVHDGESVPAGTRLATLRGSTRSILTGERTCLNLLGHLSGIATATRQVVDAIAGTTTRVTDTRKTTPGLRALEKYAVRCGGGHNHRFGLYDAVMIKDNHVAAAGGVAQAIEAVRDVGHTVSIVVEIDSLEQIDAALEGGADVVLLDNLRGDQLREGVEIIAGRAVAEASGGITADTARSIAAAGVDVISLGWITHSAQRLDVALDI